MSIVGSLAAAGMVGGLAMVLAQLTRNQMVAQKVAETGVEITALHGRVVSILSDGEACRHTLGGKNISPAPTIPVFRNRKGTTVLTAGAAYNRLVRLESAKLINISGTGSTREVDAEVTFKRLSKAITGQKSVTRKIPLTLELDAADKIKSCHAPQNYVMKEQICTEMGGTWNTGAKSCSVPDCPTGEVLTKVGGDFRCIADQSGAAPPDCSAGEVLTKTGGAFSCVPTSSVANKACPAGEYLEGFDSGGSKICKTLPSGGATPPDCSAGEALTKSAGMFSCVAIGSTSSSPPSGVTPPPAPACRVMYRKGHAGRPGSICAYPFSNENGVPSRTIISYTTACDSAPGIGGYCWSVNCCR